MKWFIGLGYIASLVFVSALAIESLAIRRLATSHREDEREAWVATQSALKFLAAPSGSILIALMIWGLFKFDTWSHGDKALLYMALVGFVAVILLSSVWMPRRFRRVAGMPHYSATPNRTDSTLLTIEIVRGILLAGIFIMVIQQF